MKKFQLFFCAFLFTTINLFAQIGTVAGTITDKNTGEPIIYANIVIPETGGGFNSDFDGNYSIEIPEGIYSFEISYVGYNKERIEKIEVIAGQKTIMDIFMVEAGEIIDEVVVKAKQIKNTENALMTIQRKSSRLIDGISAQTFRKIGDANAASAVKRVTGVSIQGGKYVFVRGLGDRYTKSLLNDMEIPGLDPDRNTIQMDIFPTNLLDNIIVSKSFSPELPGDFTGGVINIVTKDFPESKTAHFSVSSSYNPNMHFNENYINSQKSKTDWLGFDNSLRSLPINRHQAIPAPINDSNLTNITSSFANNMGVERNSNLPNISAGFSFGNQIDKQKYSIGLIGSINYRISSEYFENVKFNNYIKDSNSQNHKLLEDRTSTGDLGNQNVLISSLVGGAIKYKNHEYCLKLMHIQNGKSTAGVFERNSIIRASNTIIRENAEYTQSSVSNILLSGKQNFKNDLQLNWNISPTYSIIKDKDIRISPFRLDDDGSLTIEPSEGAQPRRMYRDLTEINVGAKMEANKNISILDQNILLKAGFGNTYKERDYSILNFLVNVKGQNELGLTGNPNELFLEENIWTPESQKGVYITGNYEPTNTYNANQNITFSYLMADLEYQEKFKISTGVRIEKFTQNYTGQNNTGSLVYSNQRIFNELNLLPAINVSYQINASSKIRASYGKTVARPSFKEASIAQIYDAISDRTFIGNINLEQTNISNYDLRLESYIGNGQMISISGFYKSFENPIEIVAFSSSAPEDLQPRNVGNAKVKGIEFELRKNLGFINNQFEKLSFVSNLTFVNSEVEMDRTAGGEYDSRLQNLREGEAMKDTRKMQGQAPYIINAYLNYNDSDSGTDINLSYNVQGQSLAIVGIGLNPDVYTDPFHNLSFNMSKTLGETNKLRISIGVRNILNSQRTKSFQAYNDQSEIFESFRPERMYSFGINYKLY